MAGKDEQVGVDGLHKLTCRKARCRIDDIQSTCTWHFGKLARKSSISGSPRVRAGFPSFAPVLARASMKIV
jgi:hypothetical protein